MTLNEAALKVAESSASCKEWRDRAEQIGSLVTRRDQLRQIGEKVKALASTAEVLSHESSASSDLESVRSLSQKLKLRADSLLRKVSTSSESLLKPKALESFEGDGLVVIERSLMAAWRGFLGTEGQPGIETVLSRFTGLRDVAERITKLRQTLQDLGSRLPTTVATLGEGRSVKTSLAGELSSLTDSGLDPDVVSFLGRSVDGVLLPELVTNQRLMDWLRKHDLTKYFRVRAI